MKTIEQTGFDLSTNADETAYWQHKNSLYKLITKHGGDMFDTDRDCVPISEGEIIFESISQLESLINEVISQRVGEWISVNDRLPLDDAEYITITKDSWYRVISFDGFSFPSQVTHWRPLPKAPIN